jgi:serine/threonine protein kinase
MPPVISTFIKDYNIKSVLHTGVNGDVLMAECKSTNQKYVLKKLDEKQMSVELIQNEIAIGENLKHPSIVKYYSSWKEGDNWYIVMEYLEVS